MNLTLSGGTPQQRRWVQDAIAQCSYPLGSIGANVTVQWPATLPDSSDLGHAHSYMNTHTEGAGNFVISISQRADDPTWSEVSGLPDPARDVYDFYKQSFVHELGHVIHFTRVWSDELRSRAAALFWHATTDGSLRRYGVLGDWSASVWQENIMEAIAECVKCAAYTGRLVYLNRTNWAIDADAWPSLVQMLYPTSLEGSFSEDFSAGINPSYEISVDSHGTVSTSSAIPLHDGGSTPGLWAAGYEAGSTGNAIGLVNPATALTQAIASVKIAQMSVPSYEETSTVIYVGRSTYTAVDGDAAHLLVERQFDGQIRAHLSLDRSFEDTSVVLGDSSTRWIDNLWVVWRGTDAESIAELWGSDPADGGTPLASTSLHRGAEAAAPGALYIYEANGEVRDFALVVTDWAYTSLAVAAGPPYPFGPLPGTIAVTAGDRGQLVLGP